MLTKEGVIFLACVIGSVAAMCGIIGGISYVFENMDAFMFVMVNP